MDIAAEAGDSFTVRIKALIRYLTRYFYPVDAGYILQFEKYVISTIAEDSTHN